MLTIISGFLKRLGTAMIPAALLLLMSISTVYGQVTSNRGSEFWIAFPTHQPDLNDTTYQDIPAKISIFITGPQVSSGIISVGNFSQPFSITANTVTEILIPRNNAYINENEKKTVLSNRAIHVKVNADQPKVVVYAHIFAGNRSAASLILPVEALGRQYYSMNYNHFNHEGQNFITLIATEDNTRVFIRKNNTELIPGGVLLPHAGDVYEYLDYDDLTGAYIYTDGTSPTCGRFAVFSGNSGVIIPYPGCTSNTLDPLYQQCYPIESWGNSYGYIPFSKQSSTQTYQVRTAGQMVRIVARDNGTVVKFNGAVIANLNSGEFYATPKPLKDPTYIEANKPVSAAQFALSQSCSNWPDLSVAGTLGDPDMVILNPVSFSIDDITIFASNRENIKEQFVNILIKTADAPSFRINGAIPERPFEPFTGMPGFSFVQLPLSRQTGGSFHLKATGGFNAIAYGFGIFESYSYSAGTSLAATEEVTGYSETRQKEIDSACVNADFYFRLTLPYRSPKISWQLDAQEQPAVQFNPPAIEITENDRISYVYKFPKSAAYAQPGEHKVKIIADYGAGNCSGGNQKINYIFTSVPLPIPVFEATVVDCSNNYHFGNQSTGEGNLQYLWDFDDPNSGEANSSAEKSPMHAFSAAGTFHVKLTVVSPYGCQAIKTTDVIISNFTPAPSIQFPNIQPVCITAQPFQLTATEINGLDGSGKYSGPGVTELGLFSPAAAGIGTFDIKYEFTTAGGCSDFRIRQIAVLSEPVVNDQTFSKKIGERLKLQPSYQGSGLNYHWEPPTGLDNADTAFPTSSATENTTYHLTITNGACSDVATITLDIILLPVTRNTFTPNGDGKNDLWEIDNIESYPSIVIDVFNRYGAVVFHTTGPGKFWDGKYKGQDVPAGTYYYTINPGKGQKPFSGYVTVLR